MIKRRSDDLLIGWSAVLLSGIAAVLFLMRLEWVGGLVALAAALFATLLPLKTNVFTTVVPPRIRFSRLVLCAISLALLVILQWRWTPPAWIQIIMFLSGIGFLVCSSAKTRVQEPKIRVEVIAVLLLAFAVRIIFLGDAVRVLVDERQVIEPVLRIWQGNVPILTQIHTTFYPYPHLHALLHTTGGSLFALRLPNAMLGTLTVAALYLLARTLYGHRTGVLAAFILAIFPLHVHFSRLALPNNADPLFGTLALAFFARGHWLYAGVALGMTHYFHESGRLFFSGLLVLWGWPHMRRLAQTLGVSMLVAAPLYGTWLFTGGAFLGRLADAGGGQSALTAILLGDLSLATVGQVAQSLLLYVSIPDQSRYVGGDWPLIYPFVVPFFLLGLGASRKRRLPMIWWLGVVFSTGLLMEVTTLAPRHIPAIPAVALLIALGVQWLSGLLPRQHMTMWGVAILLGVGQLAYYTGPHLANLNTQARLARSFPDVDDAMLRAVHLPVETQIHIVMMSDLRANHPIEFLGYLTRDERVRPNLVSQRAFTNDYEMDPARDHAIFIERSDIISIEYLESAWPVDGPFLTDNSAIPPQLQYVLYTLERTP